MNFTMHLMSLLRGQGNYVTGLVVAFVVFAGLGVYSLGGVTGLIKVTGSPQASEVINIVRESVSQGASIVIRLPPYIPESTAKVTFEPEIEGSWNAENGRERVFTPKLRLARNATYAAVVATGEGSVTREFSIVESPKVAGVAPSGTNSPAETKITVSFTRPIVALGALDSVPVPTIVMTPPTKGVWKWAGTRMLQFVPEASLAHSARYSVAVPEIPTVEGLVSPAYTHTFETRHIELLSKTEGTISASGALAFTFNVPIDIARVGMVTLTDTSTGAGVPVIARYGGSMTGATNERVEDKRVLELVPSGNLRGVAYAFDFGREYVATVASVMPEGGDIGITNVLEARTRTLPLIADVRVEAQKKETEGDVAKVVPQLSERLFAPESTVTYTFNEEIDLDKSSISVSGSRVSLSKSAYGEGCSLESGLWGGCVKVEDAKRIVLTLGGTRVAGGITTVTFARLISKKGFTINAEPITRELKHYPDLVVRALVPARNQKNGISLTDASLCSNVPLVPQTVKDFYKNMQANGYIVFSRFDSSYEVQYMHEGERCQLGEYATTLRYGLHPNKPYTLDLAVESVFGGAQKVAAAFTTGSSSRHYLSLQALDKVYNVTTPGKTKLTFAAENFGAVDVSVCKMSPEQFVIITSQAPQQMTTTPEALNCLETKTVALALPQAQWVFHYFTIDVSTYFSDARGHYVVSLSSPAYKNEEGVPRHFRSFLSVTNLTFAEKKVRHSTQTYSDRDLPVLAFPPGPGAVYLAEMKGAPSANAQVTQIIGTSNGRTAFVGESRAVDGRGVAEFPRRDRVVGAVIAAGDESAVVTDWADRVSDSVWAQSRQNELLYMYTDRPIYRPGHDVHIAGIFRTRFDNVYSIPAGETVQLEVRDARYEVIQKIPVYISKAGTFEAKITLPKNASLGTYSISANYGYANFTVAEYVPAAFEAKAASSKDEYTAGDTLALDVSGQYYFGAPVAEGKLTYAITAQDYYFNKYTDEYFSFGGDWYSCYSCGFGDTFVTSGEAVLNKDGKGTVLQSLDFAKLFTDEKQRGSSKVLVFHGKITDKKGKSVSFQKSVIVHRGDYYVGVRAEEFAPAKSKAFGVKIKTVAPEGTPKRVSGLTARMYRISYESFARSEVDRGFYNYSDRKRTEVAKKSASTDVDGNARVEFTANAGGEYEIEVEGSATGGTAVRASTSVYVYGDASVRETNSASLSLAVAKKDVKVGERVRVVVQNPFPKATMLASVERGGIYEYTVLPVTDSVVEYAFAVTKEHVPNVFVSVLLLSPEGAVRFGSSEFTVGTKSHELTIKTTPTKKSYTPGEKVTLIVTTTDSTGRAVPAHVSLAVADVSVLALVGNPHKDPLSFFYSPEPLAVQTSVNVKNKLTEAIIPTGTKGGDGGNGGDLAKRVRGIFKDTAFWSRDVVTNAQGEAVVSFTLPDNLTRWQIEAIGITNDTKVGVEYSEIATQKDLMAVVSRPRFIVPGDSFSLPVQIFNRTDTSLPVTLSATSATLTLGSFDTSTTLAPHTDAVVFVPVAPQAGTRGDHEVRVKVVSGAKVDEQIVSIPTSDMQLLETVSTMGQVGQGKTVAREYIVVPPTPESTIPEVQVTLSNNLASLSIKALEFLLAYPYGCAEQIASKIEGLLLVPQLVSAPEQKALRVVYEGESYTVNIGIEQGIERLAKIQNADGGYGFYTGLASNIAVSAHVAEVLARVQSTSAREQRTRVLAYLASAPLKEVNSPFTRDDVPLLSTVYSALAGTNYAARVQALLVEITRHAGGTNIQYIDTATLARLSRVLQTQSPASALTKTAQTELVNRVHIDTRGGYVRDVESAARYPFSTPTSATADSVRALVGSTAYMSDTSHRDGIARLLRSLAGSSQRRSISTVDSLSIARAFADFTRHAQKEGRARGGSATLADASLLSGAFINADKRTTFAAGDLVRNTLVPLVVTREGTGTADMYYDATLTYAIDPTQAPARDEGLSITRALYSLDPAQTEAVTTAKLGEVVRGRMVVTIPSYRDTVLIEDPIPAGFEIVDFALATENETLETLTLKNVQNAQKSGVMSGILGSLFGGATSRNSSNMFFGATLYPSHTEQRDDRVVLFLENTTPGTYHYTYMLRATVPGIFTHLPAHISDSYSPEIFGRSAGAEVKISK